MENLKYNVLNQWLEIDFCNIAKKAGLITESNVSIDEKLIYNSIRCLDYETIINSVPSVNYVITIIALMWEYINHSKYDIKDIIIKFLSRIGYPTSAIIVDKNFNKDNCSFGSLKSTIDQITSTLNQYNNEVCICNHKYLLTQYQKRIWDSMNNDKIIGISAPTSAGKSFVILLKMIEHLYNEKIDIVYIVPTISLQNQVTCDFNRELKKIGIKNCYISNSFNEDTYKNGNHIYVLTQEKAIAAFSENNKPFSKPLILIVDEIQNIERVQDPLDERAKILFDTLTEFRYNRHVKQIIISGPRIDDIGHTGSKIFGKETKDLTTNISPVLNITYSIQKIDDEYYFKQYCALAKTPLSKRIVNSEIINGYGQKKYTLKYFDFFNVLYNNLGKNQQNIIFAPTSKSARNIACSLTGRGQDIDLLDLIDYYKTTIHEKYTMCETLKKGIAYHHGKLPMHVRRTIEYAITEKKITTVVCTTTLMQGVNLPAQNIFIRNPHLYIKKNENSSELSTYEMANLRGRAGRLLKDFIGRTYVMDESEFIEVDGYEQISLFENSTKELPSGYKECFNEYKNEIISAINSDKPINDTMKKYAYLISYIRQSILRYGDKSTSKMKNVGIKLSKEQVAAIILKLKNLTIPKKICFQNRYWDPFILEEIYVNCNFDVPKTPSEKGVKSKLDKLMKFLRDNNATSQMYKKYIPSSCHKGSARTRLCNLSLEWANETSLYDILNNPKICKSDTSDVADNIEDTIDLLQNVVSYNLPLLLKPIFDIKDPDSVFLTSMQVGAINTISRNMIEMGIPRETALSLYNQYFKSLSIANKNKQEVELLIRNRLAEIYANLPKLYQIQVEFLI